MKQKVTGFTFSTLLMLLWTLAACCEGAISAVETQPTKPKTVEPR